MEDIAYDGLLDIMEIDIHLLEATELHHYQDHSKKIVKEIFQTFL